MDVDENTAVDRVKEIDSEEPLLQENPRRFVVFPIKHSDIWQFYKKAEGEFLFNVASIICACRLKPPVKSHCLDQEKPPQQELIAS